LLPINTWAHPGSAIGIGEPFSNKLVFGVPGLSRCLRTFTVVATTEEFNGSVARLRICKLDTIHVELC